MRLVIASDIHGSSFYANLLRKSAEEINPDRIILLGDILYHGPRNDLPKDYNPKETAKALNGLSSKILCVKGNCDAEVDSMLLDFDITSECLSVYDGRLAMYAVHGHKEHPKASPGDVILSGHTHVPVFDRTSGVFRVNPGSISIPKENSPNSFVVYYDGEFSFVNLTDGEIYRKEKI